MDATTKKIVLCLCLSWLLFSAVAIATFPSPTKTLGNWQTDHHSHWGSAVLFLDHGFDIYKRPIHHLCLPPSIKDLSFAEKHALNQADICRTPSQRNDGNPIFINWGDYPRPYPPGVLLYSIPEVLLYRWTSLPFETINLFSVVKYLWAAHLTMGALMFCFFAKKLKKNGYTWEFDPFAGFIILPVVASSLLLWSLNGVYDSISILCVILSVWFHARKKPELSIPLLSAAILLHFRALWWATLFLPYVARFDRSRLTKIGTHVSLLLSAIMLGIAGYCFVWLYPFLKTYNVINPQYFPLVLQEPSQRAFFFAVPVLTILSYLCWLRCWTLLLAMSWQIYMLVSTPEVRGWHNLFVLPIFAIATIEKKDRRLQALIACLLLFLLESSSIFGGNSPLTWEAWSLLLKP